MSRPRSSKLQRFHGIFRTVWHMRPWEPLASLVEMTLENGQYFREPAHQPGVSRTHGMVSWTQPSLETKFPPNLVSRRHSRLCDGRSQFDRPGSHQSEPMEKNENVPYSADAMGQITLSPLPYERNRLYPEGGGGGFWHQGRALADLGTAMIQLVSGWAKANPF